MNKEPHYEDIIKAVIKLRKDGWISYELDFNPSRRYQTWATHQSE